MPVTDPISDFLTRIRNASKARKPIVDIPSSNIKQGLAKIMRDQNFIDDFSILEDNKQNVIRIKLKYTQGMPAISGLKRISKPGLRVYKPADELPRVLNGLGVAVVSTSRGLMTDREAKREAVGGEIVCYMW
jgi:small subunit ribosomal protein S8